MINDSRKQDLAKQKEDQSCSYLDCAPAPLCASADVKVEGWRDLNYDYIISNINDYPDYIFLTSSNIWGWKYASMINSTGPFGKGYKLDDFIVHAIRASDFDKDSFLSQRDEYDPILLTALITVRIIQR